MKIIDGYKTTKHPLYYTWQTMKRRCLYPKAIDYKYYGGSGITVCDKWVNSFPDFVKDMGMKPSKSHTLDRINNKGNYEPENCRWATKKQQLRNKSIAQKVHEITINGETRTGEGWAKLFNLNKSCVYRRIKRGWPKERWFEPPNKNQHI